MTDTAARVRRIARIVGLVVATALIALAATRLDLARVVAELAVARPLWIVLAIVAYAGILPLWALQWRLLAAASPRPSFTRMLRVITMTSTVLNTAPLLVGEASSLFFLVKVAGLSRAGALSVLAMDQLLVGLAKIALIGTAAAVATLPAWMEHGLRVLCVGVGALLAGLLLLAWRPQALSHAAFRRLPARPMRLLASFAEALAPLRSPARGGGAMLLALTKKLVEIGAILCVARAFGLELPLGGAILVLAALNLATLIPVVPGNVGVYEAAVVLAYSSLGVEVERALGMAVVQHACYFAALALPGYRALARGAAARSSAAAT